MINDFGHYVDTIAEAVNEQTSVDHFRNQMLFQLMVAEVLANQLFDEYSEVVHEHVPAFAVLSRHSLPPTLLAPQDLHTTVNQVIDYNMTIFIFIIAWTMLIHSSKLHYIFSISNLKESAISI